MYHNSISSHGIGATIMYLEKFSKLLKDLMEIDGTSIRALSNKINVDRKSIRLWLNAKFYPRYDALVRLSLFFRVRIDYLLGVDNIENFKGVNSNRVDIELIPIEFSKKLKVIMETFKISRYSLSKKLNVDAKSIAKWFTGNSMPETANLIKLANLTNLSVDELLGQE